MVNCKAISSTLQVTPFTVLLLLFGRICLAMRYQQPQMEDDTSMLSCPAGFSLYNSSCYKLFGKTTRQTFYHAVKGCFSRHASLVSIHSAEEQEFVVQLAGNITAFWIGLNDHKEQEEKWSTNTVFKWTTGQVLNSSLSYHKWKPGEPINHKHKDCVKSDSIGWSVAQGGCGACKLPYVCKKQACPEEYVWMGRSCVPSAYPHTRSLRSSKATAMDHKLTTTLMIVTVLVLSVLVLLVGGAVVYTLTCSSTNSKSKTTVEDCHWRTWSSEDSHQSIVAGSRHGVQELLAL